LIVEDEALIAWSLKERIEQFGYRVTDIVDTGEKVLENVKRTCPDLILMDINLKGKQDGIETAYLIQKQSDVPVIFLTSYSNKATIDKALKCSPYGYIVKTIDDNNLHITIDFILNKHQNHQKMNYQLKKEVKENEEIVKKVNEEMDQFAYNVSHTIRGPISSMLGLLEVYKSDNNQSSKDSCLDMLRNMISKLDSHVHNIMDFNESTRSPIVERKVNLKNLITENIKGLKHMENWDRIQFLIDVNVEGPVFIDAFKISVVLKNLLSNAIRFHNYEQQDPWIRVAAFLKGGKVSIIVEDNGIGIDRNIQKRVFELFFRGHETSTGEGIGLYIVREVMTKLKGEMKLRSKPNKGTSVLLEFYPTAYLN